MFALVPSLQQLFYQLPRRGFETSAVHAQDVGDLRAGEGSPVLDFVAELHVAVELVP